MGPLTILSSSAYSVRLKTSDADGPIVVVVERSAIDDRLGLDVSTDDLRWDIVQENSGVLADIVRAKVAKHTWTQVANGRPRQVVIRIEDLREVLFRAP